MDLLLKAPINHPVSDEYTNLANKYKWSDLLELLEENNERLNNEYHKVYRSYVSRRDMPDTKNSMRVLMHKKIRRLQEQKGVSNYRIYTDLKLDQGNINAFLKNGEISKVSMKTTEDMIAYLETV